MKRPIITVVLTTLVSTVASSPAMAQRGGFRGGGPRGGSVGHVSGPYRSGTVVHGPYGGSAAHVQGPYRSGTAVSGPHGGGAAHVQGPYGGAAAVRGPHGGVVAGGVHYGRPGWDAGHFHGYQRRYYGYPGWRTYGMTYGLAPALAGISALGFLSSGLLVGSYADASETIYVYVVEEDGQQVEYRVTGSGTVLSRTVVE
jgi:hypothetical protein